MPVYDPQAPPLTSIHISLSDVALALFYLIGPIIMKSGSNLWSYCIPELPFLASPHLSYLSLVTLVDFTSPAKLHSHSTPSFPHVVCPHPSHFHLPDTPPSSPRFHVMSPVRMWEISSSFLISFFPSLPSLPPNLLLSSLP